MTQDRRYHVKFVDTGTGDELGLILTEGGGAIGYDRRLVNPFAAKLNQGDTQYRDLTDWTVWTQKDWSGGFGYDDYERRDNVFRHSEGVDTRFDGMLLLGPAPQSCEGNYGRYANLATDNMIAQYWGHRCEEINANEDTSLASVVDANFPKLMQPVEPQWQPLLGYSEVAYVDKISLYLRKSASVDNADTFTLKIYDLDANDEPNNLLGSKQLTGADVSTSWGWIDFEFATPVDVSNDDEWAIVLENGTMTGGEHIQWRYEMGDVYKRGGDPKYYDGSAWHSLGKRDYLFKIYYENVIIAQQITTPAASAPDIENIAVWTPARWFGSDNKIRLRLVANSGGDPDTGTVYKTCILCPYFQHKIVGSGSTTTTIELDTDLGGDTDDLQEYMWVRINGEERMIDSVTDSDTFVLKSALSSAPDEGDQVVNPCNDGMERRGAGPRIFRFDTAYNVADDTNYWFVLDQLGNSRTLWCSIKHISMDRYASYTHGSVKYKLGSGGSWTAWPNTYDLVFRINKVELDGDVIAFEVYNDKLYCAAGNHVYEWDEASWTWSSSRNMGAAVTSLETWGGLLWAAAGASENTYTYDGSSWSDTGERFTLLYGARGYLHASGASTDAHKIYYYTDPAGSKTLGWTLGPDATYPVTGMAWVQDYLIAATEQALWSCYTEDYPFPIMHWKSMESEYNGKGMVSWPKDGAAYIPLKYNLYRFDGDTMTPIGPGRAGPGLPDHLKGKIVNLLPTQNWLLAAVDSEADGHRSSILAYDGMGAWHILATADASSDRIRALGFSELQEPDRVHYGLGSSTRFLKLPDKGDNVWNWNTEADTPLAFNSYGSLTTAWIGSDLNEVVKDLHEVTVLAENLETDDNTVTISYQLDRAQTLEGEDLWVTLVRFSEGRRNKWQFAPPDWGKKKISAGGKRIVTIDSDYSTDDISPGDCALINGEPVQITSIQSGNILTFASSLEERAEAGDYLEASYPLCYEFRFRIELEGTPRFWRGPTPKVDAIIVKYQNNVLDRFVWSIRVAVEEGGWLQTGGVTQGLDAASLRGELDNWAQKQTPFTLVDPDGREFTVKVTRAAEGRLRREEQAGRTVYHSVYTFTLVEID